MSWKQVYALLLFIFVMIVTFFLGTAYVVAKIVEVTR